jgi:hypothetical protein
MMEWIFFAIGIWILSRTPLGMAMVERVRSGSASGPGIERRLEELEARVASELEALREDVVELQERLDFAERALTAALRSDALPRQERA